MTTPKPPTNRHHRLYLASGLLAIVVLATACGASHNNSAPTTQAPPRTQSAATTAPRTTSPRTTTTQSTTTTVLGPSGPPANYPAAQPNPPSLAGAYPQGQTVNLVTVIKTLTVYEDWVWSHPNPSLVANYELQSGNAYAQEFKDISEFAAQGLHAAATPTEIDFVHISAEPRPQPPQQNGQPTMLDGYQWFVGGSVTIVYKATPTRMLKADGKPSGLSFSPEAHGEIVESISLVQGPDGQFRIEDSNVLHPAGGIKAVENQA